MKIKMFYHSLLSDWNHGNAHFLRGIVTDLKNRNYDVTVYEPENNWSLENLRKEKDNPVEEFHEYYPQLQSTLYDPADPQLKEKLADADLVIVHEWNDHDLISKIGDLKKKFKYKLLFHDTHHRSVTDKENIEKYDLSYYDGVLAFGDVIKDIYIKNNWTKHAFTWHEAADVRLFQPLDGHIKKGDLVWIGNWGDDERTRELQEFLIEPVKKLGLKAKIYGVRYPDHALKVLKDAGIEYGGYLPNYKVPEVFAQYKVTVHVPRRPYTESLPGIPTIRPFEAMACGIPLISSPWNDAENLFRDEDFRYVKNKQEMKEQLQFLLKNKEAADKMAANGLQTIRSRHTCTHRVNELLKICMDLGMDVPVDKEFEINMNAVLQKD